MSLWAESWALRRSLTPRKERKRNLLPAWVGIYGIIMFLAHTVAWQAAFAIKVFRC